MIRVFAVVCNLICASTALADNLRLAVTTSFQNSGLADVVIPAAEADLGFEIDVLVAGTGQALRLGSVGDVDAVLVHAPEAEAAFVAAGHAPYRREIMYNTFVILGPSDDPANVKASQTAEEAFRALATNQAPFVSRGDESGTHKREQSIWSAAGLVPEGKWYRSVGAGMGASLNIAAAMNAYVLSDSSSWANFGNRRDLVLVFEGDPKLLNQYAFLPMSIAERQIGTAAQLSAIEAWLTSERGQHVIGSLRVNGNQLFVPNARID